MGNEYIETSKEVVSERAKEIQRHLDFIKSIIDDKADRLARFDKKEAFKIIHFCLDRDFTKTQLATTYLMLYNLVEAVLTNIFLAVHEAIKLETVSYDELSEELKKVYLANFKSAIRNFENAQFVDVVHKESEKKLKFFITFFEHDKQSIFNGNITNKIINNFLKKYGIEMAEHDRSISRSGICLEIIKENRNELAHGAISFIDCGQKTSVDELESYLIEVQEYLGAIIAGAETYLDNESYKI